MFRLFKEMETKYVALSIFLSACRVFGMILLPTMTADIIDYGVLQEDMDYIIRQGLLMIGVALLVIAFAVGSSVFTARETQKLGETVRNRAFKKIVNFSKEDLDQFGTASLITRTTNDVMQLQFVLLQVVIMLGVDPFLILGATIMAFTREPKLAFVFIITAPLMGIAIWLIMRSAQPLFRRLQRKTDEINRIFREGLTGVRVVRAFNKSKYEEDRFASSNQDFKSISIGAYARMALMMPVFLVVIMLTNIMILWFGANLVGSGQMQVGNLVAFLTYAGLIMMGIMLLAQVLSFIPRGQIAAERILAILNHQSTIKDDDHPDQVSDQSIDFAFEDVDFRYPNTDNLALEGINMEVKAGQTLAIIGGTGSGKSTIANLMIRLYDVESGSIKLNGQDIRYISQEDLRDRIGFAPQEAILFSGTIRENLTYGHPDASDQELWEALEIAQGKAFVEGLEDGLDAKVEQGGGNFSGGQRQRLSIARALVTDADLLVFDDSFSALDFKTDANLRAALTPVTRDKAVVIIAQRISTVVNADEIIVLEDGKVVGAGKHEDLKESNSVYQEIIQSQMRGEEV